MNGDDVSDIRIVVVDPSWEYSNENVRGAVVRDGKAHYLTSPFETMRCMKLPISANEKSVMFMWCVFPQVSKCKALMERWGHRWMGVWLIWYKTNPRSGTAKFGGGTYARANAEFVALGMNYHDPSLVGREEEAMKPYRLTVPVRESGRKPYQVYELILLFCERYAIKNKPYEMFTRCPHPGFISDVDSSNEIETYASISCFDPLPQGKKRTYALSRTTTTTKKPYDEYEGTSKPTYPSYSFALKELPVTTKSVDVMILEFDGGIHQLNLLPDRLERWCSRDSIILFRSHPHTYPDWATEMDRRKYPYKTIMFYVFDDNDATRNVWYGVCLTNPKARFKKMCEYLGIGKRKTKRGEIVEYEKRRCVSQIVPLINEEWTANNVTNAILKRMKEVRGNVDAGTMLVRANVENDLTFVTF